MKTLNKILLFFILLSVFYFLFSFIKTKIKLNDKKVQSNQEILKVKLAMGYVPNIQFAPFYLAQELGYFKDLGLDLEFNYQMETDVITLLADQKIDFGIASGEQVILARTKGLSVINFFNWYPRFPVTITYLKEKNIQKPTDLYGKTVGIPVLQGASFIGWQAFLKQNQLEESKIKLQVIGYTQVESLIQNKVDAAVCYLLNEPIQLKAQGFELENIYLADFANLVSNGLIANEKTIQEKPELVKKFAKAFKRGLEETISNPEAAFNASLKFIPELEKNPNQKQVLLEAVKFWQVDSLGLNDPLQWQKSVDLLSELKFIEQKPALESLFTNNF